MSLDNSLDPRPECAESGDACSEPRPRPDAPLRASDEDRNAVLVRLHTAYAEGRLDEHELDERIERVLVARTHAELDAVGRDLRTGHLTGSVVRATPVDVAPPRSGRLQLAVKSDLRRAGYWTPAETGTVVIYKGAGLFDLRAAELAEGVRMRVLAYKSDVRIIVATGTRVAAGGAGVSVDLGGRSRAGAPTLAVQGLAYRGSVVVTDRSDQADR